MEKLVNSSFDIVKIYNVIFCRQRGDVELGLSPPPSQIALKFGLRRSRPSSPNFALPQSDRPFDDLSVGDIRWQIAAEWLEIAQWSQWRAYYRKPLSLVSNGTIVAATPTMNGVQNAPPQDQLCDACGHLANDRRYRQDLFCIRQPYRANTQITLTVVSQLARFGDILSIGLRAA